MLSYQILLCFQRSLPCYRHDWVAITTAAAISVTAGSWLPKRATYIPSCPECQSMFLLLFSTDRLALNNIKYLIAHMEKKEGGGVNQQKA